MSSHNGHYREQTKFNFNIYMKRRKQFVTPKVVQEVQIQLEKDMLEGGSAQNVTKLQSMGIDVENYDFSEGNTDGYTVEWYD